MNKLLSIIHTLFVASSVWAQDHIYDFEKDGIYYCIGNTPDEVGVACEHWADNDDIGENTYSGNVIIPESVTYQGETYSVTAIERGAFANCPDLTSITIPSSVEDIGAYAFYRCIGLTSILIPNGVTLIRYNAFEGCTGITSISIPESMTIIEEEAFANFTGLTAITIPESVDSIGENVFEGCTKLTKVTCLASMPPAVNPNSFANYNIYLYVPCDSKEAYDLDAVWGNFKHIECIGSTAVSEVSNATAVTIVNCQILVNGEAPAFVVTVSGQKIANANLKAGVYFVVVDGKSVSVSVR